MNATTAEVAAATTKWTAKFYGNNRCCKGRRKGHGSIYYGGSRGKASELRCICAVIVMSLRQQQQQHHRAPSSNVAICKINFAAAAAEEAAEFSQSLPKARKEMTLLSRDRETGVWQTRQQNNFDASIVTCNFAAKALHIVGCGMQRVNVSYTKACSPSLSSSPSTPPLSPEPAANLLLIAAAAASKNS